MLVLCILNEVDEFTLLDVAIVDNDGGRAALHLLTELCIVLLMNLYHRVSFLCDLLLALGVTSHLRVLEDIRVQIENNTSRAC